MTYMPVLDKNSGVQNILSAKGTKTVPSSGAGDFDAVLKQTNNPSGETAVSEKKTETVKSSEAADETKGNAIRDKLNGKGKTEEGTKAAETEETKAPADMENLSEDAETLEKAGGEMLAALSAQLNIPAETIKDAMADLQMTEVSLLQPENVKELMIRLTDGADSMSMLTDGDFYQSVTKALETLNGILEEAARETGMEPEELKAFALDMETGKISETIQEEVSEMAGSEKEAGAGQEEAVKLPTEDPRLTETARTETVPVKEVSGKESHGRENTGSSMQENFQNPVMQHEMQAARMAEAESTLPIADTQEIMDQIMDYMKVAVKPELSDLEMQLHPESLGNLHIHISSKEGIVTAQFTAQSESVRAVLESQMMELKQNLEAQGVKVEAVEVTVAQYSLDRNPGGEDTSSGQGQRQKKGTRNLNLSELDPENEELTEEERLTAEMMRSEGSTISYTA